MATIVESAGAAVLSALIPPAFVIARRDGSVTAACASPSKAGLTIPAMGKEMGITPNYL